METVRRVRLAVGLLSLAVIGLELALMRILSLRFWDHFAAMVIAVALLGFGCSGAVLTLVQSRLRARRRFWLTTLALAAGLVVLLSAHAVQRVPLDVHYLAWSLGSQWRNILAVELLMLSPFLLAGAFIGLSLMDHPDRIAGHYTANLVGSGLGAVMTLVLMYWLSPARLVVFLALMCLIAGLILVRWADWRAAGAAMALTVIWVAAAVWFPPHISISPYKKLALEKTKPGVEILLTRHSPLGRIDVVTGPAVHDAPPGMSLQNPHPIPPRTLMLINGGQTYLVFDFQTPDDRKFLDWTTTALPFGLVDPARVLIAGVGGGAPAALADLHFSGDIVGLAANPKRIDLLTGPLAGRGGRILEATETEVHFESPRGYLRRTGRRFDLIVLPLLDPAGMSGAGLGTARENHLLTIESMTAMINGLDDTGVLALNVAARNPPRDGLRLFNTAAEALRRQNLAPDRRMALIRSWETITVIAAKQPLTEVQLETIRLFAERRGFDLGYLPGLRPEEANRYHVLQRPFYFEGTGGLLGPQRRTFIDDYLFDISAPTDDRPYFDHFLKWRYLPELKKRLGGAFPAFMELGSLLSATALIQVVVLAAILIFPPLLPRAATARPAAGKGIVLAYFFCLGLGFMLVEMGFLQKMVIYLAHPIYSAAGVIASFLIFAGVGSRLSGRWNRRATTAARTAALVSAVVGLVYLLYLDPWLSLTQSWGLIARFGVTALTIAPLAVAMGHLFPLGLRRVGENAEALTPWSWGVNGFASVLATAGAPLLAMWVGFSRLILIALICYLAAAALFGRLPGPSKGTAD